MPRKPRLFVSEATYHVYSRVARGEFAFDDPYEAEEFVETVRRVGDLHNWRVLAWCLMGNHYHLVVRMGAAPLSRSMKSLQQQVTRSRNRRVKVFGPMWQGRFKAKQVDDEVFLEQLIAYVHLNPVNAGIVDRPKEYRWSGHRDVLGLRKKPLVSVDDVLATYGASRRQALAAYRSALRSVGDSDWSGDAPGHLPWWRLGRPRSGDDLHPIGHVMADELGRPTSPYRARFEADAWIKTTCRHFDVQREDLASRSRKKEIVRVRELIGLVGVERYGVKVKELAASLGKSEDGVSLWVRRGAKRRMKDAAFAADAEALDAAASEER